MPFINLRLYIYAALLVVAIGLLLRYNYLSDRVSKQDIEIAQYKINAETAAKQIKNADAARTAYLTQLEASKHEIDILRSSVSSGATVLRVKAKCSVPKASPNTAGASTAAPELTEDARQDYYSLISGISEINSRLDLCVKTLQDERK